MPSKRGLAGAILAFLIASILVCAYFPQRAHAESSPCENLSYQEVLSPNGAWKAVTTQSVCENGYAFLAFATYIVALVNVSNPSIKEDVFGAIDDGADARPAISWSGNTTLKISAFDQHHFTNLQLTSYRGINIVYSFRSPNVEHAAKKSAR